MKELVLSTRDVQIDLLDTLIGRPEDWAVPCLFIYGHTSCGKSTVLSYVFENKKHHHVIVNCIECYSTSLLYDVILQKLGEGDTKCENMNTFVRKIQRIKKVEEAIYIILDKAEALRDRENLLLPTLVNLQELTSLNLCVVLVSSLPWEKFSNDVGLRLPHIVYFPDYSKGQLTEILCHLRPPDTDERFYREYVASIIHVFASACKDLRELRHLAETNFPIYCAPINKGLTTKDDRRKLWKLIEPHFQRSLQHLYLRETQSNDRSQDLTQAEASSKPQNIELPFYSKFLLISSYIASFNPTISDRRFFLKNAGRMKKSVRSTRRDERKNLHLRGPRAFPIDRLMAIFYSIVDGRVPPSANLFAQVTSLLSLHLLAKVSHEEEIDTPRYKCLISLDRICDVARTVEFDIVQYLYDFI